MRLPRPRCLPALSADRPPECRWQGGRGKTRISVFTTPLEKDKKGFYEAQDECCVPIVLSPAKEVVSVTL